MTLFDFRLRSIQDQVTLLYRQGVYIGKRKEEGRSILLYQLESFYVEVVYRKYRQYVERLRCSATTSLLDPYLEQINVEDLVSP